MIRTQALLCGLVCSALLMQSAVGSSRKLNTIIVEARDFLKGIGEQSKKEFCKNGINPIAEASKKLKEAMQEIINLNQALDPNKGKAELAEELSQIKENNEKLLRVNGEVMSTARETGYMALVHDTARQKHEEEASKRKKHATALVGAVKKDRTKIESLEQEISKLKKKLVKLAEKNIVIAKTNTHLELKNKTLAAGNAALVAKLAESEKLVENLKLNEKVILDNYQAVCEINYGHVDYKRAVEETLNGWWTTKKLDKIEKKYQQYKKEREAHQAKLEKARSEMLNKETSEEPSQNPSEDLTEEPTNSDHNPIDEKMSKGKYRAPIQMRPIATLKLAKQTSAQ